MTDKKLYERYENEEGVVTYKPYDIYETTICGKTTKEIIDILNCLEIERITEMEMTLKNLSYLFNKVMEEQNEIMRIQLKKMIIGDK